MLQTTMFILSICLGMYAISILVALFFQSKMGAYEGEKAHDQMMMAILWPLWLRNSYKKDDIAEDLTPKEELEKLEEEYTM